MYVCLVYACCLCGVVMARAEEQEEVVVIEEKFICPEYESALELEEKNPEGALKIYNELISTEGLLSVVFW